MPTRNDVTSVPPQGGYVAKRCPVRVQNDTLRPAEPLPPSPVLERRFALGREFESTLLADLLALHPTAVVIEDADAAPMETATSDAMASGVPLILGGRLPCDEAGRRVGKPDLLVAASSGGYRPVDVKHHAALEPAGSTGRGLPGLCSALDRPSFEDARIDEAWWARKRKDDLLQLAHYQRMLEAAGTAATDARHGGIIGVERNLVWYDLDAPIWRTPSSSGAQKLRTTMEIYDFEFDFRLDIIAVAQRHAADPSIDRLVVPVKIGECAECPWWDHCRPQLEVGSGDVSLIPRIGWREWKIHRDHGVTDREELAALDARTARLVAEGVDVAGLVAMVAGQAPATSIAELPEMARRKAQLELLRSEGVSTAEDVDRLAPATASYSGAGMSSLPEQIDRARVALGPDPVYRRRGIDAISVPRADVEVDVDMENVEDGVYLWGTFLTDRSDPAYPTDRYRPFVSWEPLTPQVQTQIFLRFWTWLMEIRAAAHARGRTFRAYCYHASAENTYLLSLGRIADVLDQVEEFIASDEWVDMLRVFDTQLITGGTSGLKVVAPLAGFSWSVEDAGGAESMLRHDVATGSASEVEREDARRWLLTYNRDDVEATLALRDWLENAGGSVAAVETLDRSYSSHPNVLDRLSHETGKERGEGVDVHFQDP